MSLQPYRSSPSRDRGSDLPATLVYKSETAGMGGLSFGFWIKV